MDYKIFKAAVLISVSYGCKMMKVVVTLQMEKLGRNTLSFCL